MTEGTRRNGATLRPRPLSLAIAFLAAAFALPSHAASLTGKVTGPGNAGVSGAKLTAIPADCSTETTVSSGADGAYAFPDLPAGLYQLRVTAAGFQDATRPAVEISSNASTVVNVSLTLQPATFRVEVTEHLAGALQEAVAAARVRESDVTAALRETPGYSTTFGGGVAGLPVLRGLGDDRVNVLVNGMSIGQACSTHMNPPLSYTTPAAAAPARKDAAAPESKPLVISSVTPVSLGGDSTAGTIVVDTPPPPFLSDGRAAAVHGGLSMFHRTNGVVNGGNAWFSVSGENFGIGYSGNYVDADNYKDGAGRMVKSTFYEAQNHALQIAARQGANQYRLDLGYQRIPQQGFANARMDMTRNEAKYISAGFTRAFLWAKLDAKLYYQDTRHQMNILRDKIPGMSMPMDTRGVNIGYSVTAEKSIGGKHTLRLGHEMRRFSLDDWWPPVMRMVGSMGPDTLWNVRDGRRTRLGAFGEWESRLSAAWTTLFGVRVESVGMNTGDVVGYNTSLTTTGSAMYAADAAEFNALDRARRDLNVDVSAMARYDAGGGKLFEFGFARKMRSPSLYERYLWVKRSMMSINMNGWFGDGNGYTGNPDLRPEAAHHFAGAVEWRGSGSNAWKLRVAPFVTLINDFIDVRRCPVLTDLSNGCSAARFAATSGFTSLQFFNYQARLAGVDGSWQVPLLPGSARAGSFVFAGVFSYVRGKNTDTGQNLYNIMPVNVRTWIEHRRRAWTSAFEFQAVDAKRNIQAMRNELPTAGYALMNVRTSYRWTLSDNAGIRLDGGVENLANRMYALPLGGRYWIGDMTGNTQVPGSGRNLWTALTFEF